MSADTPWVTEDVYRQRVEDAARRLEQAEARAQVGGRRCDVCGALAPERPFGLRVWLTPPKARNRWPI